MGSKTGMPRGCTAAVYALIACSLVSVVAPDQIIDEQVDVSQSPPNVTKLPVFTVTHWQIARVGLAGSTVQTVSFPAMVKLAMIQRCLRVLGASSGT